MKLFRVYISHMDEYFLVLALDKSEVVVKLFNVVPEILETMPNVVKVENKKFGDLEIDIEEIEFINDVAEVSNQFS